MAFRDYLTGEVAEDWLDGLLTRREAIRRLVLLGMTLPAAGAFLAACAAQSPTGGPTGEPLPSGASPTPAWSVGPEGGPIRFPGPREELQAFFAPAATALGAILVIHENRGLNDHIRSVARRLAGDGYSALAIDLLSEEGGTDAIGQGVVQAALANATTERLVGDMRAGLDELVRRAPEVKLAIIGFCFGGAMVWTLLDAGEPRLAAAIPFYGPAPDAPSFDGNDAAVFAVYAELDDRVNASRETTTDALEAAGLTHQVLTYPDVDHAFFNDTGGRYDATQAEVAYADVLAWLEEHVAGT